MRFGIDTFTSLIKRSLPPVEVAGSAIVGVAKTMDEMVVRRSIGNARGAVEEAGLKREAEAALERSGIRDEGSISSLPR